MLNQGVPTDDSTHARLRGRDVLVVGGGSVGARKARTSLRRRASSSSALSSATGRSLTPKKSEPHRPRGRHRLGRADRPGAGRCRDRRLGPERRAHSVQRRRGCQRHRHHGDQSSATLSCLPRSRRPRDAGDSTGGRAPALSKHRASGSKTSSKRWPMADLDGDTPSRPPRPTIRPMNDGRRSAP